MDLMTKNNGGEGGIRTLGGVTPTHPFQGCTFGHSVISPIVKAVQRIGGWLKVNRKQPWKTGARCSYL